MEGFIMKEKLELEYQLTCSASSLFRAVSTPAGLKQWFAEDVSYDNQNEFVFSWSGTKEKALLIESKENLHIKFAWEDEPEYYLNFRIDYQELMGGILLTVTDFAERSEIEDTISFWNLQIDKLKRSIGCSKN